MLDCKHAGPSLPPSLPPFPPGRGLGPHSKPGSGGREARIGRGRGGTRVPQVWGGERDLGAW